MAQPLTLLIIDDSPEDREVYRRYLQQDQEHCYTIIEQESGEEALALCQQFPPDGILLDFLLPDLDGLEFLAELQKSVKEAMPAVVMLTGYGNEELAVQAMKSGVHDYLVKGQTTAERLRSTLISAITKAQLSAELRRSQEQLRESQKFIERIAETTPGILYVYDLVEQRNVYLNGQVVKLLGYSCESIQALGAEFLPQLMYPDDLVQLPHVFHRFNSAGDDDVIEHEYRMRHANGEWRWFCSHNSVFTRNADGSPRQIVGTAFDITGRKQIDKELRASNERFRLAAAAVNSLIYDWNVETDYVTRTQGLTRILGYSLEEAEPTSQWWLERIHPEDRDVAWQQFQSIVAKQNLYAIEYRILHKHNYYVYVLDQGLITRNQLGKPVRVVGSTTDISDRKYAEAALRQSEERYRYLSNAIPQLVWITNTQIECVYVNQRWHEFTGMTIEQASGFGWKKAIHPDDIESAIQAWMTATQTGESYEQELRYQKYDGSYRWHLARAVPIKNEQGKIVEWFGTSTDIDDYKKLEAERDYLLTQEKAARAEAEAANQAKDEFVAIVSHDLRSPLSAILGWAQILRHRQFDETIFSRAVEIIIRNAHAQGKLLEDLLDISRILRGNLQLEFSAVNLAAIIGVAMETAYPSAQAKNIILESVVEPSVPMIIGDANRLLQVLGNLLSNAIKFTPDQGTVTVRLLRNESEAYITVTDTGMGISPEFLPYVFERYRQADRQHRQGGLGLGLAIARHIIELHGGTIQVTSPGEGKGATFTIKLPLQPP
ncbi:PAS domain-containing protein [Anabaena sp. 4-3]|uniref:PAS domain-containing protein n=1 Tax=Anabaena sp. 4-3 TaxID=1811979 RepID=UPI0008327C12|nr:PAS domain-containing protein [Anabaena sp. 4-3]